MSADSHNYSNLREIVFSVLPQMQSVVSEMIYEFVELQARKKIGPKDIRIGVFGPYPQEVLLDRIAKHIATLNFASITGQGYYLPENNEKFHPIKGLFPTTFKAVVIPHPYYGTIITRIASKAIFVMTKIRGQVNELLISAEYKMPVLGLVKHDRISKPNQDCSFLAVDGSIARCIVPHHSFCPASLPKHPFCPFVDSASLPYLTLDIFHRRKNDLVTIKSDQDLEPVLHEFLKAGREGK